MARTEEPTTDQEQMWTEWIKSRPENVRKVAERFDPWSLYRMKDTDHRVMIASFGEAEDGSVTLTVNIFAEFNLVMFERQVFGVNPDDLEPCEIPGPDEATGALMTNDEADQNIDAVRVAVRPDLWVMGPDGKATRRDN